MEIGDICRLPREYTTKTGYMRALSVVFYRVIGDNIFNEYELRETIMSKITKMQHDAAVNTIAQWNVQTAQADGVGEGDYDLVSEYTNDSFEEINIKVKEIVLG